LLDLYSLPNWFPVSLYKTALVSIIVAMVVACSHFFSFALYSFFVETLIVCVFFSTGLFSMLLLVLLLGVGAKMELLSLTVRFF
jgi:uncharacterized membrane protein